MTRAQWLVLAQKRLVSVLGKRVLATDRTLEQKISDAGPTNQRVEPKVLTDARNQLMRTGRIVPLQRGGTRWFHLSEAAAETVEERLAVLEPIYQRTQDGIFKQRVGQTLEIAVFKALQESGRPFLGNYPNLDEADKNGIYEKTEPATVISGRKIENGPLDYAVFAPFGIGGIEIKNYRTWVYPDSSQVKDMLSKCSDVGAVPVLITRRVPFITFRLLNLSGCLVHQTYGQLYATRDGELAALVRDKDRLGYHDVRVGSEPDNRLRRFISDQLPDLVDRAQHLFQKFEDVHRAYGRGKITYGGWVETILIKSGIWKAREEELEEEEDYPDDYMYLEVVSPCFLRTDLLHPSLSSAAQFPPPS